MPRKPLVTRFHLLLLGLLVAVTATAFVKIPADAALPVHWGLDGHPDQVWPRIPALLMFPLIGAVITGLFLAIGRFTPPEMPVSSETTLAKGVTNLRSNAPRSPCQQTDRPFDPKLGSDYRQGPRAS